MLIFPKIKRAYQRIPLIFHKILLVFLIAISIPVALVSTLSIQYSTAHILEQAGQTSANLLLEKRQMIEAKLSEIDSLAFRIISDEHIWQISNPDDTAHTDYFIMAEIIKMLNSELGPQKQIDSIYFFDSAHSYILSNATMYSNTDFIDKDILTWVERGEFYIIPRQVGNRKVITYYRKFHLKTDLYVFINLDFDKFFKDVSPVKKEKLPHLETILFNNEGIVVFSSNKQQPVFDKEALIGVSQSEDGYRIYHANKEEYFVSKTGIHNIGWTLAYVQPYSSLAQPAKLLRNLIMASSAIVLLLSFVMSYFFTVYLYKPLSRLLRKVKELADSNRLEIRDEYKYIDRAVLELFEEKKKLQSKVKLAFPYFQLHSIKDLLEYKHFDVVRFNEVIQLLGVEFIHRNYLVALVEFENQELTNEISENIDLFLSAYNETICCMISKVTLNRIAMIINTEEVFEDIRCIFEKMKDSFNSNHTLLTIALGKSYHSPEKIIVSYQEALQQMNGKFFIGHNRILYNVIDFRHTEKKVFFDKSIEEELLMSVKDQNLESSVQILNRLTANLTENTSSIHYAKYVYFQVVSNMIYMLADIGITFDENEATGAAIFETIEKSRTIHEVQQYVLVIIEKSIALITSLKNSQYKDLIGKVISFLQENYHKSLSLEEISNTVYLSPRYLSSLFKAETGLTIFDYITKLRMEFAAGLILNNNIKIQDAASAAGYNNVQSFIRVFKKYYQMTPVEYRRKSVLSS